jgi:hypothetical protein
MIILYLMNILAIVFAISLILLIYNLAPDTNEPAAVISGWSMIASTVLWLGLFVYSLSIADVIVKCHHLEVVDIRQGEKNMLVLKNDQGGYFEQEASLADQYELSRGDDYWIITTEHSIGGHTFDSISRYAYTCTESEEE